MSLRTAAVVAAAGLVSVLIILWQGALLGRERARRDQAAASAALAGRSAEAALNRTRADTTERALTREIDINNEAKEAADDIARAQEADAPVAADVRDRWSRAVDRLRGEAVAGR